MKVALIVALDLERGIGKNNDLMWHLPADMKFFKEKTTGQIVVMGRKNFDSIPEKYRPLPNRENAVLTRSKDFKAEGCLVFHSLDDCLDHYRNEVERTIFIIGGGEIYNLALKSGAIEEMYISHVNKVYEAETFFPEINPTEWHIEEMLSHEIDERHEASFTVKKYTRK